MNVLVKASVLITLYMVLVIVLAYNYMKFSTKNSNMNRLTSLSIRRKHPSSARIFCIILTSQAKFARRASIIYNSWARKCDNYAFVAKIKNKRIQIGNDSRVTHLLNVIEPPRLVHDKYKTLTTKVLLTFEHLYSKMNDYDWYLKSDDDTLVFVDNLRSFLADKNASEPVTFGFDFTPNVYKGYHSGGAGYMLSNEALTRLGSAMHKNASFCLNTGMEDVDVARCLRQVQVYPSSSLDQKGRERFHPFSIWDHYTGYFPDWFVNATSNPVKTGLECCSDTSISFHYMTNEEINAINTFLNNRTQIGRNLTFEDIINELKRLSLFHGNDVE